MATRKPRRAVDGVLVLDKPLGVSSNAALQIAKRLLGAEKAGHTGTLDPLATGVLPLCFGAATKLAQVSLDADKRYLATLRFGVTTTTGDLEGEILHSDAANVSREQLEAVCAGFTGALRQRPPMHSALKKDGKPLYEYARAGIEVEREERDVTIHSIGIVEGEGDLWSVDVSCSKGTYIRTLAEDIGRALGCGAHLSALRRTGSGGLSLTDAVTIEALEALPEADRASLLLPADALVAHWPAIHLSADDAGKLLTGMRRQTELGDAPTVRVYGPDPAAFLGIAHITGGELIATRLLSPAEVGRIAAPTRLPFEFAGLTP
jgi:tRNA pseudouridine55 synthase